MVAEFDARDGGTCAGLATTAQWLGFACGIAPRTAIEHVRVARALITHAWLAEEMTAGRLSYSHARAISRVAQPAEGALVEELIQLAEHATVRQLEATVRGLRTVRDVETPTGPPAEYATHTWTSENQWRLTARLDPERGAVVASAIAAVVRQSELSAADALVWLAEVGLAAIADEATDNGSAHQDSQSVHVNAPDQQPAWPTDRVCLTTSSSDFSARGECGPWCMARMATGR